MSYGFGRVGPATIIFCKNRATRNTVIVLSCDLYEYLRKNKSPIIESIGEYKVTEDNSPNPLIGQTKDLFMKFTKTNATDSKSVVVDATSVSDEIECFMKELAYMGIVNTGSWRIDIPLSDRTDNCLGMNYAFINFDSSVTVEQAVYVKAVLNGFRLEKNGITVSTFWLDGSSGCRRSYLESASPRVASHSPLPQDRASRLQLERKQQRHQGQLRKSSEDIGRLKWERRSLKEMRTVKTL